MSQVTRLDMIEKRIKCLEEGMVESKPDVQCNAKVVDSEPKFKVGDVCWSKRYKRTEVITVAKKYPAIDKMFYILKSHSCVHYEDLTLIPQPSEYGGENKSLNIKDRFEQDGKQYEIVACRKLKSGDSWIAPSGDIYHDACDDNTHIRFIVEPVESEVFERDLLCADDETRKYKFIVLIGSTKPGDIIKSVGNDYLFFAEESYLNGTRTRFAFATEDERQRYEDDIAEQKQEEKAMQPTGAEVLQALKDSRPHWLENASIDDLKDAKIGITDCSLCILLGRHRTMPSNCDICLLNDSGGCCCIEWRVVDKAELAGNLPEFRKASLDMVKRLDREIAKLEGKPGEPISTSEKRKLFPDLVCKTEEQKLKVGWYYREKGGLLFKYNDKMGTCVPKCTFILKPATLSDLSVEIPDKDGKPVKCWFVKKNNYSALYFGDKTALTQGANDPKWLEDYAELKHASVICQAQWDEFDEEATNGTD